MRILILDDDAVSLQVLHHVLSRAGYDVHAAADGAEALGLLHSGQYRLVISDWMMPGMDGLELCRRIRREDFSAYIYFILLTSLDGPDNIVQGLSAGADEFITKPFNAGELLVRVRTAERILSLETRDVTIFSLAKLAESRDQDTGAHLDRVRAYSRLLAESLTSGAGRDVRIDPEFVRLIYLTSPLHDVGKVGIPDSVLLKPGPLTPGEFEVMKTHTTIGAETFTAAIRLFPGVRFLEIAREIALTHHERYDGTGYPAGLRGRAIPLAGRIVALADVYDALTSKRVYKDAYDHERSRSIIVGEAGSHFDPEVVEAFQRNEQAFVDINRANSVEEAEALLV